MSTCMSRDRIKWIEAPNWMWTVYLDTGKQMRVTAVDLLEKVIEMPPRSAGKVPSVE